MSANQFLQEAAVDIAVGGRYSLTNWYDHKGNRREFACRTSRVSPFRMLVSVPVIGKVGERVVSHFGDFGKLDGWISDTVSGGFLLDLALDRAQREKLAGKLTWLEKRQRGVNAADARDQARIIPVNPHSTLMFADGSYRGCFIIDMSAAGAAVSADVQPRIGTPLSVGCCVGRVVRHFTDGFAVKFIELQDTGRLEQLVARPDLPRTLARRAMVSTR